MVFKDCSEGGGVAWLMLTAVSPSRSVHAHRSGAAALDGLCCHGSVLGLRGGLLPAAQMVGVSQAGTIEAQPAQLLAGPNEQ